MADFLLRRLELSRATFSTTTPSRAGRFQNAIECLLALAEEQIKLGEQKAARETFQFILKIDPKNEKATWRLCETNQDWWEAQKVLRNLLAFRPESTESNEMLQEAKARCAEFEELEELVSATLYRKLLTADREKRFAEPVCPPTPTPIRLLGRILVDVGYINYQQLESTLNLQAMLLRYGTHQPIGKMLLDSGYLTERQLNEVLQAQELEEGRTHCSWSSEANWPVIAAA